MTEPAPQNLSAAEADAALRMLTERAILTRTICRELVECGGNYGNSRPATALGLLLNWIRARQPHAFRIEPRPCSGLDALASGVTDQGLLAEVSAASDVAEALMLLLTADSLLQADADRAMLEERLMRYWESYPAVPQA